jgi:hypothetical protein
VAESPSFARFRGACLPLDTKCPESELNQKIPSSTPDGRTRTIHILHPGSNNEYKLIILSPFHTTQSLRNSYYNTRGSECDKSKQRKLNKHLAVRDENPSVPTRRILHTRPNCSRCTCNKGKINYEYTMYSQDLPD